MRINKPDWAAYMAKLSEVAGVKIANFADLKVALGKRIDFFNDMGCRASDHALEYVFCREASEEQVNAVMKKAFAGEALTTEDIEVYKTALLIFLRRAICSPGLGYADSLFRFAGQQFQGIC
jgi:glucuronate isomerase